MSCNVIVQPIRSAKKPASNGLSNAPILPHKFIQPETVPEKLRPKSVAAAQLIPIDMPIPPKHNDNQKTFTYKSSVFNAKIKEIQNTTKPKIAITPRAINFEVPCCKILSEMMPP